MTAAEMQSGYYSILERLFSPTAMYRRSGALIDRIEAHIFRGGGTTRWVDLRAALRSLWRQGIVGNARREYFKLLWKGAMRDAARFREAGRSAAEMQRRIASSAPDDRSPTDAVQEPALSALVDRAREAMVRVERERPLAEVDGWTAKLKERIDARAATQSDLESLYRSNRDYFERRRRLHRFPGAYLVKAFNLAIKGLHYEVVMKNIMATSRADGLPSPVRALGVASSTPDRTKLKRSGRNAVNDAVPAVPQRPRSRAGAPAARASEPG
jgi:hypothetical protein